MPVEQKNGIARSIMPIISKHHGGNENYDFKVSRQIVSIVTKKLSDDTFLSNAIQHLANNGFTVTINRQSDNIYTVEVHKKSNVIAHGRGETVEAAIHEAVSRIGVNGWLGTSAG